MSGILVIVKVFTRHLWQFCVVLVNLAVADALFLGRVR